MPDVKTYEISDDDFDSILMRLRWDMDPWGEPNRHAQRLADELERQRAEQES